MRALAVVLLLFASCSRATAEGRSGCHDDRDCPSSFPVCRADQRCWSTPDGPDAPTDGGADAPEEPVDGSLDGSLDAGRDGGALDAPDGAALDALSASDAPDALSAPDAPDAPLDAPEPCLPELPTDVGTADFRIDFDVRSTAPLQKTALVGQRDGICNAGHFWDVVMADTTGVLEISMDDMGASTVSVSGCRRLPFDGAWHHVVVQRVAGRVMSFVDGEPDALTDGSVVTPLRFLPPLVVGRNVCESSGVAPFDTATGEIANVCARVDFTALTAPALSFCR